MCPAKDRVRWPHNYSPVTGTTERWKYTAGRVTGEARLGPASPGVAPPIGVSVTWVWVSGPHHRLQWTPTESSTGICILPSSPGGSESPRATDKPGGLGQSLMVGCYLIKLPKYKTNQ